MKDDEFKEVALCNVNSEQEAAMLAESGVPFVLVGFSYSHDINFYEQLKSKYELKARFDNDRKRAYFWKET